MTISALFPDASEDVKGLNPDVFKQTSPARKHPKYLSNKCEYGGVIYPSEWEAEKAQEFDLRWKAGDIAAWTCQVPVMLRDGIVIVLDFLIVNLDGTAEFVEAKSKATRTRAYMMKLKMFKAKYPNIKMTEMVKKDWHK